MPFYSMPDQEKLFVRRVGEGEPVLVLSGLGMQSWQWLPFLFANRKQYEFIIPDWRGFGGSKNCAIPELDAISSHWNDVDSLIKQLKLDQFILMGYSMGATTAMHGMKHGGLAEKLKAYLHIDQTPKIAVDDSWQYGLFGPKHPQFKNLLIEIQTLLLDYKHAQKLEDLPDDIRYKLVSLWGDFIELQGSNNYSPKIFKLALNRPFLQKYLLPIQRLDYLLWYVENYLNHNEDYREAISQLSCPTTFFIGRESTLYPETGQTLIAESLSNATAIYFERSGHTPLITEPRKFSQEIGHFLAAQSTQAA
ncbi:peroxidase [Acinetobacter sp. Ac_3412]|uniref:alpha/beta fold hydrolase n=1 Tax=Acinetobacter TaxID=469 RepID=UPI0014900DE4|nr:MULTISPECIES: alpha/beta hydrolase [Acinetobacter]MCH7340347.1 alpha/beta hydrolase [Acinetobacter higginsii]NNP75479.1 peroxidase [Acinetobacter sp. Ac_3412]